ncbi:MAG: hypothetical protein AVDCRST_MAG87-19 [uncultured Thermomicrobiales bacterium]|uniref:Uncharacterized protein n=1 Tax=uncultured Thermomicrobiales bacterium TaxID=1645740 RepID=A0A6J4U4A9_9BACT|nr:MAG: hypothetical protein AVDCRST_MAG87-19 [uncultured Thermomicrobiales bacterium]
MDVGDDRDAFHSSGPSDLPVSWPCPVTIQTGPVRWWIPSTARRSSSRTQANIGNVDVRAPGGPKQSLNTLHAGSPSCFISHPVAQRRDLSQPPRRAARLPGRQRSPAIAGMADDA